MENYLQIYNETNKKLRALGFAFYLSGWDGQTEAPKGCFETRAKYMGSLSEMRYALSTATEYEEAIYKLYEGRETLDPVLKHEIEGAKIGLDKMKKIPKEEYVKYSELSAVAEQKYFEAKAMGSYEAFKPYLEQIIEFQKKYVKWQQTKEVKGYNILLDEYEKGMTTEDYDKFFGVLKEKLVPFVKKVTRTKLKFNKAFVKKLYPADKQREFAKYIQQVMCFDMDHGVMKESEHPFTTGADSTDVRVTIHYYEDNFQSAIFSAIHEMGHGTYEQQCDPALIDTMSGGGASMGMHESQSRFYENIIGRSYEFWQTHFAKLQETFPKQLKNVTVEDMYKAVNTAERSFIRTEADELTYPLHIMLRYDIERKIFAGKLTVDQLPAEWNKLVKKYLGLTVTNDRDGIMQDVHWAGGSFGYFPTYALGSAYAAQIYHKMCEEIDVPAAIKSGNLSAINAWLKEKIHRFGSSKDPKEILKYATGEDFNPEYYVNYLIEKYSKVYGIEA